MAGAARMMCGVLPPTLKGNSASLVVSFGVLPSLIDSLREFDAAPVYATKKPAIRRVFLMAGAARIELATPGFGDRCSTS